MADTCLPDRHTHSVAESRGGDALGDLNMHANSTFEGKTCHNRQADPGNTQQGLERNNTNPNRLQGSTDHCRATFENSALSPLVRVERQPRRQYRAANPLADVGDQPGDGRFGAANLHRNAPPL
jgi:hypothetical protein